MSTKYTFTVEVETDNIIGTKEQIADALAEIGKVTFSKIEEMTELETLKRRLTEANNLICELCTKCGENVCKNGEECEWEEREVTK